MPEAKVKTKTGAEITIVGSGSEIADILANLEFIQASGAPRRSRRPTERAREGLRNTGPTGLVVGLKVDGFFDKPKSLGEIASALHEKGSLIPTTTISGVVLGLLRKGLLHRKRVEGRWLYGN
jgi:hypothetical protein